MRMSEVDEKRSSIKKIVDYINTKDYGTTIEFMELQPFTTYNLNEELEFYWFKVNIITKVKKELIKYGKVLKSVKFIGYYILKPNQISSYTYRTYIRKPLNSFKRAQEILNATDTAELNIIELEEYNLTNELNSTLIKSTKEILYSNKYLKLK